MPCFARRRGSANSDLVTTRHTLARAAVLACTLFVGAPALAQPVESSMPGAQDRPSRGMAMSQVEARYGAPATRSEAVGQPPITRWDYPGMIVYFEHGHVVHAVLRGT
jgi:hypothetical protein